MVWDYYPLGTKVHSVSGGYWIKVDGGWKWFNGDVFPTPGADYIRIELPSLTDKQREAFKRWSVELNKLDEDTQSEEAVGWISAAVSILMLERCAE